MIEIINQKISPELLISLCENSFKTMVKFVVDIEQKRIAVGGDLHSDGESLLLKTGSVQDNLWGANLYPYKKGEGRLEYTSLINIRPRQENNSMQIEDIEMQAIVKSLAESLLLGAHEDLA